VAYLKLEKATGDFAIAGAAARVALDERGHIASLKVALSAVGNRPVIAHGMMESLLDRAPTPEATSRAADTIRDQLAPPSDIRASSEYRRDMAVVYAKRAVLDAVRRAKGEPAVFVAQNAPMRAN
jgi:aerobic carbon-monoxide dehydrogenase medium subunit